MKINLRGKVAYRIPKIFLTNTKNKKILFIG